MSDMMDKYENGEACPAATGDLTLNLRNRGKAIDKADYGPMNPDEPNDQYWQRMARRWDVPAEEAKTMRCGNCAAFIQTAKMLECIRDGMSPDAREDVMDTIEAGNLGFCSIFDFKCAADRTCSAWIVGGPITDEEDDEEEEGDESEYGEDEGGSSEDMSAEEEE